MTVSVNAELDPTKVKVTLAEKGGGGGTWTVCVWRADSISSPPPTNAQCQDWAEPNSGVFTISDLPGSGSRVCVKATKSGASSEASYIIPSGSGGA